MNEIVSQYNTGIITLFDYTTPKKLVNYKMCLLTDKENIQFVMGLIYKKLNL